MQELFPFESLPRALAEPLLAGGVGRTHLLGMSRMAQSLAGQSCLDAVDLRTLALDLALAAWEGDPLDGEAAGLAVALASEYAAPEPFWAPMAADVARAWSRPGDLGYYHHLLEKHDPSRTMRYLEEQRKRDPGNLFWLQQAAGQALYEGDHDRLAAWLSHPEYAVHGPVLDALAGGLALCRGDVEAAARSWLKAAESLPLAGIRARAAESLFRLGDQDAAQALLWKAHDARPWDINLLLRLHDAVSGLDRAVLPLNEPVAILLYSYNKAALLEETLESLYASELGGAVIRVLDNGSRDGTAEMLSRWRERFGSGRFGVVALPLNIGAPAARNWLSRLPEVRACGFAAFLDDDVLLPSDWLGRLGAAVQAYPDAGVWGARVLDGRTAAVIQCADLHLTDPQPCEPPEGDPDKRYERRFGLSSVHHQVLDAGQFCYVRPCVSVTGCCHLFRVDGLLACGDFDLRFSPSQYDDLDHDLRLTLMGRLPVYQGHLAVRHMKRTGKASLADPAEFGNAYANLYKLHNKYSHDEIRSAREEGFRRVASDARDKACCLAEAR